MALARKCTLPRCKLAFGLAVVALLMVFYSITKEVEAGRKDELDEEAEEAARKEAAFFFRLRPRLGHFATIEDYIDLYEEYFDNVISLDDKSLSKLDINDWRRGRPTGKQCATYLQDFQVRNYKLSKPYDIIILDACLDWLFPNNEDKEIERKDDWDRLEKEVREDIEELKGDEKLAEIFKTTKFKNENYGKELLEKLHSYFSRILKVNADYPKNWCHGLWMQAYNDFIEEDYFNNCKDERQCNYYGLEDGDQDPYLKLIAESTKQNTKTCYTVIQKQMISLMQKDYQIKSGLNLFVSSKAAKQAKAMKWSQEMMKILQLSSGVEANGMVDLVKVVKNLNKIKTADEEAVEQFTDALGDFALKNTDLKATAGDEKGLQRYKVAMTKLCYPYINPKEFLKNSKTQLPWDDPASARKPFEFYNLIYNLIRITNHVPTYGITKKKFENDMIDKRWVPLYLATFACQIISTTWGTIDYTNNEAAFDVSLRPNAHIMLADWPIDELMTQLGSEDSDDDDDEVPVRGRERAPPTAKVGSGKPKAKMIAKEEEEEEEEEEENPRIRNGGTFNFGRNIKKNDKRPTAPPPSSPAAAAAANRRPPPPPPQADDEQLAPSGKWHHQPPPPPPEAHYEPSSAASSPPKQLWISKEHQQAQYYQEEPPAPLTKEKKTKKKKESYTKTFRKWIAKKLKDGDEESNGGGGREFAGEQAMGAAQQQIGQQQQQQQQPKEVKKPYIMSYDDIIYFRDTHGRYPSLPPNIHEIYPQLPRNLDGVYPKVALGVTRQEWLNGITLETKRAAAEKEKVKELEQQDALARVTARAYGGNMVRSPPMDRPSRTSGYERGFNNAGVQGAYLNRPGEEHSKARRKKLMF